MDIQGVADLYSEKEEKGEAVISKYVFRNEDNPLYNLRAMRDSGGLMCMEEGEYVRLHVNGELMMSDTRMERITNTKFCYSSRGKVLIAGLGIGLILKNILDKKQVTEVIVIEKYQGVIDLVEPKFRHPKLTVICADIFEWKPEAGTKFDTIYFDIWPNISTANLKEIKKLHARFRKFQSDNCWMDSWMRELLIHRLKEEKKEEQDYDRIIRRKIHSFKGYY